MTKRDISDGFRRILYDAMILSASLRAIRDCKYYRRPKASDIDGYVEGHHVNALIQMRSMIDFLSCSGNIRHDTMTSIQFYGCAKQSIKLLERQQANKYAAHKSWDAVAKNAAAGARQLSKKEVVELGLKAIGGFYEFWDECKSNLSISLNPYAKQYKVILEDNVDYLNKKGP